MFVDAELFDRASLTPDELTLNAQGYTEKTGKELHSLLLWP